MSKLILNNKPLQPLNEYLQPQKIYDQIVIFNNETRKNKFNPIDRLSIPAEINERFAEEIAKRVGVKYIQQSCLAIENENMLSMLKLAHQILSQYMEVGEIRRSPTAGSMNKWLFTFYSEP